MTMLRGLACCVMSYSLALPTLAQDVATAVPQLWQADAKTNRQAQKAAEERAAADAPPPRSAAASPNGGGRGEPPPGDQARGSGMGRGGRHHGGARDGGHGRVTADAMFRPEMEFAAPLEASLVLYRSREAVVFGNTRDSNVVILPLTGEAVTIAPGVTGAVHDDAGALSVEFLTTNGIHVTCRYRNEGPQLVAAVKAEGPFPRPGSDFEVERRYHPGNAD
ncbi:hypothetical protein MWN52_05020 [Pseudoxanthomonas winnipegensis]|uniref:hypothetical protein n=1 Tax=Pseudoxanthomonas winnipegensis TaxID=2480810 RepID=UPI002578EF89|nr:hypothetical protein [Pseudoxanthomonas winnipegensis]WJI16652.1 hypothetical protein MWN52_05020 [Pseudoxanthomonas winnipegensis]